MQLVDSTGYRLSTDSFVHVVIPRDHLGISKPLIFRGLVVDIAEDELGPYLVLRQWEGGKFNGHTAYARPAQVTVKRAPKKLRADQVSDARRRVAAGIVAAMLAVFVALPATSYASPPNVRVEVLATGCVPGECAVRAKVSNSGTTVARNVTLFCQVFRGLSELVGEGETFLPGVAKHSPQIIKFRVPLWSDEVRSYDVECEAYYQ